MWAVNRADDGRFEVAYSIATPGQDIQARVLHCRHVILATGAQERPFPISGWTLPGVITAGAAQILLKTSAVVPTGATVLAGGGPLLYLLAWQYLNAGVKIHVILETTPAGRWRQALPFAWGFLRFAVLGQGSEAALRAVKAQVPIVSAVQLAGSNQRRAGGQLGQVRYKAAGETRTLMVDQLLLHQGVVPNTNLSLAIGADHVWCDRQDCWEPVVDAWGATSVAQVTIAGDGAGIAGAVAAEHRGRIAAIHAAGFARETRHPWARQGSQATSWSVCHAPCGAASSSRRFTARRKRSAVRLATQSSAAARKPLPNRCATGQRAWVARGRTR